MDNQQTKNRLGSHILHTLQLCGSKSCGHLFAAGQCALTFEEILFFGTGLKQVPPLGFSPSPTIEFLHNAEGNGNQSTFPKANTCSCCLQLPVVHTSYAEFVDAVVFAIKNSQGFGYAWLSVSFPWWHILAISMICWKFWTFPCFSDEWSLCLWFFFTFLSVVQWCCCYLSLSVTCCSCYVMPYFKEWYPS